MMYSYTNLVNNPDTFKKATGLTVDEFHILFRFLNPGENCRNVKFYESNIPADKAVDTADTTCGSSNPKRGPKPKLGPKEQLFMFLSWLKNGFTVSHISWLFERPKSTVSRYLITWSNFLYMSLGSIPTWPSKEQILDTMPDTTRSRMRILQLDAL